MPPAASKARPQRTRSRATEWRTSALTGRAGRRRGAARGREGGGLGVVRDQDDRPAVVGDLAQQPEHLVSRFLVEVAGRLVGEDQARVVDQGAGDREPLLLAAGQHTGQPCGGVGHPEAFDHRPGTGLGAGAVPRQARREQHVLGAGQLGQQVEELEHEPDQPPAHVDQLLLAAAVDAHAVQLDLAGIGPVEPAQHVQQRRLPRPRAADHRNQLAAADGHVEVAQQRPGAAPAADRLGDAPRGDDGRDGRRDQRAFVMQRRSDAIARGLGPPSPPIRPDGRYPVVWCTSRAVSRGPWAESSATRPMPRT